MKARIRLKSFWRHNKCCPGMYSMLIVLAFIALPPYDVISTMLLTLFISVWILVWNRDRKVDTYRRMNDIFRHLYIMKLIEMHKVVKEEFAQKDKDVELMATKYHEAQMVIEEINKIKEEIGCHEAAVTMYLVSANRRIKRLRRSIAYKQRIHKMEVRQLLSANHSLSSALYKMKSTPITPGMLTYDDGKSYNEQCREIIGNAHIGGDEMVLDKDAMQRIRDSVKSYSRDVIDNLIWTPKEHTL